ncbi:MAG: flagellar hook-length control protein FliK [Desulfobacterales bacterium]|nr:flagellar hook-length control protein FliK [Desulfobacterales bacterium]MCP4161728.1 flagellar hook-length control protein FliK [Deltaproteobacteria bacterium]
MITKVPNENILMQGPIHSKDVVGGGDDFSQELGMAMNDDSGFIKEVDTLTNTSDGVAMAKKGIFKTAKINGINLSEPGKPNSKGKFPAFDMMKQLSAEDIIKLLTGQISAKGMNLNDLEANKQSLHEIKEFFKGLGFNEADIEELTGGFEKSGDIKLRSLFNKLSKLEKDEDDTVLMDVSSVPFIKAILSHLGVGEKQIEGLLSGTKIRNFGVDANRLFDKINEFIAQNNYKTPVPGQFAQSQAHHLMDRIDLTNTDSDGPITLAKFALELKQLVASTMNERSDNKNLNGKMNNFFDKIKVKNKAGDTSSQFGKFQPGMIEGVLSTETSGLVDGMLSNYSLLEKVMEGMVEQTSSNDINFSMMRDKMLESLRDNENIKDPTILTEGMKEARIQNDFAPDAPKAATGKTLPSFVMEQVSRQLVKSVKRGDNQLLINIKPPRLGRLQMSLENASNGLKISIVAEHSATKEMLTSQISELRNMIAEQGVLVDSIDVEINQDFGANLAQQGNDFHSAKDRRAKMVQAAKARGATAVNQEQELVPKRVKKGSGNLDLVA